jgi:DNA repair protein RadC
LIKVSVICNTDIKIIKKLIAAGEVLDIQVLDHLILCLCGVGSYLSLANEGRV